MARSPLLSVASKGSIYFSGLAPLQSLSDFYCSIGMASQSVPRYHVACVVLVNLVFE